MPEVAVIDAGVALSWFVDAPGPQRDYALSVLKAYHRNQLQFVVPDVFFVEVPYALMKARNKRGIPDSTIWQAARFIDIMTTSIVPNSMSVEKALIRSLQWELKSYDATYFDLAVQMNVPLAAIDGDLIKKAKKFNVQIWQPTVK